MILRMLGSFGRFVVHVLGVGKPAPTSLALMTGEESCAEAQEPLLRRAMKAASVPEPALEVVAVEREAGPPVFEAEIIETAPDDAAVPRDERAPSILDELAPEPEVLAAPVEEAGKAPEIACPEIAGDEPCAAADMIEIEPVVEIEVADATEPVVEDEVLPVEAAPIEAAPAEAMSGKKAKAKKAAAKKAPKKRAAGKRKAAASDAADDVACDTTVTDDPDDDGVPVDTSAPFETRIETPAH